MAIKKTRVKLDSIKTAIEHEEISNYEGLLSVGVLDGLKHLEDELFHGRL